MNFSLKNLISIGVLCFVFGVAGYYLSHFMGAKSGPTIKIPGANPNLHTAAGGHVETSR